MIAALPNGRWAQSESAAIASRLVALLPAKGAASPPPRPAAAGKYPAPPQIARFVLMAILGGAMFFSLTHWNSATVVPDKPPSSAESGTGN
jgi:hypothetical protein